MPECRVETLVASRPGRRGRLLGRLGEWLIEMPGEEDVEVRRARLRTLPDTWLVFAMGLGWSVGGALFAFVVEPAVWTVLWLAACIGSQAVRAVFTHRFLSGDATDRLPDQCLVFVTFVGLVVLAPGIALSVRSEDDMLVALGIILTLGWMSYVASLLSAFLRMSTILLYLLAWSMAAGLVISPRLWPIGVMAFTFPVAFHVMMKQNHATITGALRAEHENRRRSMHDPLTGLPNRLHLQQWFAERTGDADAGRRSPVAVLYLDLDGFKAVNDRWGHAAGDEVLTMVGDRIRSTIADSDFACRLGGDEFVVVQGDGADERVTDLAERLISACSQPYELPSCERADLGVSVGISTDVDATGDADAAIASADRALYRSKRTAKGWWTLGESTAVSGTGS